MWVDIFARCCVQNHCSVDTVSYSEVSQQLTCFADPLEVSLKGFGEVFSHSKFSKRFPSLHSRSFIAELSVNIFKS